MSYDDIFELMTGEGALSIREWCEMTDLQMVALWIKGYNRRHKTDFMIGKVLAKTVAHTVAKNVPEDFPWVMPWENEVDDPTAGMSEDEKQAEIEKMLKDIYGEK